MSREEELQGELNETRDIAESATAANCRVIHDQRLLIEKMRATLEWYAAATYPDDGSGRPPEAFRRRALEALQQ